MTSSFHMLGMLSRQIHQAHRSAVQAELSAEGLQEIGHPMLLTILHSSHASTDQCSCHAQRDLAEHLHISPAAVTSSLKSLERGGYIHREPGEDARRNQVLLTEKGQQAVAVCKQAFQTVAQRMLTDFSPEEEEQLLRFCQRMLDNLHQAPPTNTQRKEGT